MAVTKTKEDRTQLISKIEKEFSNAETVFFTDFSGINVEKINQLRKDLRESSSRYLVIKNNLAKIALEKSDKKELAEFIKGPVGAVFSMEDATVPAKILKDFQKENKNLLEIKAAFVEGKLLSKEDAVKLADIPSREILLSQLLSVLNAPVTNIASSINAILVKAVRTIDAVREKKESETDK